MSNMLQRIGTGAAALAAPLLFTANAGALPREFQPSPGYPPDQPTLPTKPTPGRAEIAGLSRRGDWDLDLSSPPVLIADAKPLVVAQVAPRNEQLANPVVRPPNYGRAGAEAIVELEHQKQVVNLECARQLQENGDKFQQFLKQRPQKVN
jgi:hypothetical protein